MKQQNSRPTSHSRLFTIIRHHGLDTVPRIKLLMDWIVEDPKDRTILNELWEVVEDEIKEQRKDPDPFRKTAPRDELILDGELRLGTIPHHNYPYGIDIRTLVTHLLLLGRTGGGKTTVIKNLLMQILRMPDAPKLMILERKQEFTELLNVSPDLHILDVETLAFNPLCPPKGIAQNKWIGIFTECMVNHLDIREASSSFLMEHATRLIKQCEKDGKFPTLGDLKTFIAQQPYKELSKNGQQKETVLNRLNDLFGHFPAMFSTQSQTDIEKLVNNHCLILLHDITHSTVQNFVMTLLMAQAFLYRKLTCGLQGELTNLIVFDEASGLFRRKAEEQDHVPFIADLVQTARGYGIGLIAASQYSTDLAHSLLANAGTRMMVGGFGRKEDTDTFLNLRGCSKEQHLYVNRNPAPGKAFIADNRWPHNVECNMTLPDLPDPLNAAELQARMQAAADLFNIKPEKTTADHQQDPSRNTETARPKKKPKENAKVESVEVRLLKHIYDDPFVTVDRRSEQLGIPSGTLQTEIKKLKRKGLVEIYPVHSNSSGRPRDLFEILDDGLDLIGKPPHSPMRGRGGYLHRFYQLQVSRHYKKLGYRVEIEGMADNKNIDVIAEKPGEECIAIEIELQGKSNPGHIRENIAAALAAKRITRILCLATIKKEVQRVEQTVTKHGLTGKPISVDRLSNHMEVD